MKDRFRLIRRGERGTMFYCVDSLTGKRASLQTKSKDAASQLVQAKNQALRQPSLNLQIAKAYLAGSDSGISTRTWQQALGSLIETKQGPTKERWLRAAKQRPFDLIRWRVIIETQGEDLLEVLRQGTVSTNVHLRKIHNFCLGMNWLPWPILPKRQWPAVRFKEKRAITWTEHQSIIARELNPERRAFYELCWHLGGSQSDIAHLRVEDVDWQDSTVAYQRQKTDRVALLHFGEAVRQILQGLPSFGPLFPYLSTVRSGDRATEFKQRCVGLGIVGVTLHSYRYAWAERAKTCSYPERFAQEALGHESKAVHRSYAKKAPIRLPSLEEYEQRHNQQQVISFAVQSRTG